MGPNVHRYLSVHPGRDRGGWHRTYNIVSMQARQEEGQVWKRWLDENGDFMGPYLGFLVTCPVASGVRFEIGRFARTVLS